MMHLLYIIEKYLFHSLFSLILICLFLHAHSSVCQRLQSDNFAGVLSLEERKDRRTLCDEESSMSFRVGGSSSSGAAAGMGGGSFRAHS